MRLLICSLVNRQVFVSAAFTMYAVCGLTLFVSVTRLLLGVTGLLLGVTRILQYFLHAALSICQAFASMAFALYNLVALNCLWS